MRLKGYKTTMRTLLIYYPKVWLAVLRKSLTKAMTYRFEFFSKVVRMFLIVAIQVLLIRSVFAESEYIRGWTVDEYYLLVGFYNIVIYLGWGIFNVNLWRLEEKVLRGEFDLLLLYPTGSVFSASLMEFFIDDAIPAVPGILMVGYYVIRHMNEITWIGILGSIICLLSAFIVWFSLNISVAAMNFISVKNGILEFLKGISKVGSFPIDIFSQNIKILMFTIFPIAFIAVVPTRLLSGTYTWDFVWFSIIAAVTTLFIALQVWNFSIRSYTSAGG
ncbi:ABC-2 family transporter protein [Candidatus Nomurabacteria bacterium]|nr:ABC-2 family transporter protein [Candidatus Nomurabacteria bacterium]